MPHGQAEILPGVGHGPGFQRGDDVDVNARLLAFLDATQDRSLRG